MNINLVRVLTSPSGIRSYLKINNNSLVFEIFLLPCDFYKTLGRNASDIAKHRVRRHTQSVEFTKICPVGDCTENYRTKVWIQN